MHFSNSTHLPPAFFAAHGRAQWRQEVAALRSILLVQAASLSGFTHQRIADELGLTQSGVSRMLKKVSRTATLATPRDILIPAADAAVTWLAERQGFDSATLAERCWHPTPFVDYEMLAMMLDPEELEYWSEPMIDVYVTEPAARSVGDVRTLEGTLGCLLRRNLLLHCTYLGTRCERPEWLYCSDGFAA